MPRPALGIRPLLASAEPNCFHKRLSEVSKNGAEFFPWPSAMAPAIAECGGGNEGKNPPCQRGANHVAKPNIGGVFTCRLLANIEFSSVAREWRRKKQESFFPEMRFSSFEPSRKEDRHILRQMTNSKIPNTERSTE